MKWLELSPELDETINDMLFLGVDVDLYLSPTPEDYKQFEKLKKEWNDARERLGDFETNTMIRMET